MFYLRRSEQNAHILGNVNSIPGVNSILITDLKITSDSISFNLKDDDPFLVCEFLSGQLLEDWLEVINVL